MDGGRRPVGALIVTVALLAGSRTGSHRRAIAAGGIAGSAAGAHTAAAADLPDPEPTARGGWYAAPNGSTTGQGTINSPWDLATAAKGGPNGASVKPGDTIWVRGGTYLGHFGCNLVGTAAAPIVLRNYPGERVIVDQNGVKSPGFTLLETSRYAWVWGLEFTNSEPTRIAKVRGSFPGIPRQYNLVNIYAPNCKLINCIVHDGGTGIGIWQQAMNSELYGNITYNNGWIAPDRGHGHGIYTQNIAPSIRSISEHIDFNDFDVGLHGYGQDAASQAVQNTHVTGYVGFNSGSWVAAYLGDVSRATNFLIGTADGACSGINVQYCYTYEPAGCSGHNFQVGFEPLAPIGGNADVMVENSYFAGSADTFRLWYWQQAKVDHNVIFARQSTPTNDAEYAVDLETTNGLVPPLYAWDHNTYYATTDLHSGVYKPFTCSGVNPSGVSYIDYPTWKAGTGFDANSTFVGNGGAAPSGTQVFVRPNAYEAGRAHVIVYNWPKSSSVSVDLSTTGLANGQNFEIRNTQNYFGSPVLSGTYSSASPVVNLPMTDLTVTAPVGLSGYTNPSTLPEFGAFVVLPR